MYTLEDINKFCEKCTKCRLHEYRTKVVFGEGFQNAKIMFIGEGPGCYEDKSGKPFVGPAGNLLDKILDAIHLRREEVYIANIVKCRPPNNRNPLKSETEECIKYLRWQVKLIRPKIIVCLGAVSAQNIIDQSFRITQHRGRWIQKGEFLIIATYHPAALLRDEKKKGPAWEDFKAIKKKYSEICFNLE